MLDRFSVSVLLIIATLVWGVFLWILGIELSWDHAKPYSFTLAVLTSLLWLFDKHLWKAWPIKFFCKRPNLNGTWQVSLQSSYVDPETSKVVPATKGYAAIRQTFSSISLRLMTEQADSFLIVGSFDIQNDGVAYLYGAYQSDPTVHLRSNVSEIHYGSFKYKVIGGPPFELSGHYWTDRKTSGTIRLFDRREDIFDSFSLANDLDLLATGSKNT
ncbi:hypothetical protein [uncultured Jannaschia sp.]|uniref:Cap15 family cyclic dinucleotide receptor domain-containing protein n=1 Tax=uncultured Jannaschia sp. TaxID=293347 RepID=UPI00260F3C79|nr:hypothetical protein [uncultured Jannaschia sp.]